MQLQQLGLVMLTTGYLVGLLFLLSRMIYWYGVVPLGTVLTIPRLRMLPYYIILFPGTVIHEFSHWLGCKITLVPVIEFVPFSPQQDGTLGWVRHKRAGPLRGEIISFAPLVGGILSLYALSWLFMPDVHRIVNGSNYLKPGDLGSVFYDVSVTVVSLMRQINFASWTTWAFLYFAFAIGRGMIPSTADLVHLAFDLVVFTTIGLIVAITDAWLKLNLASLGIVNWLAEKVLPLLVSLNFLLVFSVVAVSLGAIVLIPISMSLRALRSN